jgi:hypothetical protein
MVKGKEKVDGPNNHQNNFGKFKKGKHNNKHKKNKSKGKGSRKVKKAFKCHRCGGPNHIAKKCNVLQHLYQKFLKDAEKAKGSYEAHFNAECNEATTSRKITEEVCNILCYTNTNHYH